MRTKRLLAVLLAVITVVCTIPFTAFAASPTAVVIDGEKTVFVSSFGKMNYGGKSYVSFKNMADAFAALGAEGGRIVFSGNVKLGNFDGIQSHGKVHIQGIGTKSTGNVLDFTGTAEAPITEVSLKGDLVLDFLNIRFDENAVLFTNGYKLETINEFDTYHTLTYVSGADNVTNYPNPPSVAPGTTDGEVASVILESGTYNNVTVGAVNGKTVNSDTFARLNGGNYASVVAGSANGAMTGNAKLYVADGKIDSLVAGSTGGTINGNISVEVVGGKVENASIGAAAGATVNGNVTFIITGGTFANQITNAGAINGKKIIIFNPGATATVAGGAADYLIKLDGGLCEPVFENGALKGFRITDTNGIPSKSIKVNGADVNSENGVYNLSAGTSNVVVTTTIKPELNKNANYVAGYTDGTFGPEKNMTKAEAATLLSRTIIDENLIKGVVNASFQDVEDGAWYESYIGFLEKLGYLELVADDSGTRFSPNENITRAQFVQMVYKIMSKNTTSKSTKLVAVSDVDSNNPYLEAVSYAVSNGIVAGYPDGTFKPDNNITRAEVVTIVNRMLGRTPTGNAGANNFSDIASHWANGQVLAACNPEGVAWTATVRNTEYVLTGKSAAEYIPALYEQGKNLDAESIQRGVDVITEQMKKDILNTPNTAEIYADRMSGNTYYISEKNGNDENDGKSPETAVKTLAGLNKVLRFPQKGTAFLFERGGVYRGTVSAATNGLVIGSYGEGPKPIIMQSKKNYADPALWVETAWPNVWKCTDKLNNVGVIGFDHDLQDYSAATYDETYGIIMNANLFDVKGVQSLSNDLEFYSVLSNDQTTGGTVSQNELYLYSKSGNPGERFKSIEIGENVAIISGKGNDVVIDNISFKFTGGHGMGGAGGCKNRTVTNCIYSWLGGSVLSLDFRGDGKPVNYGNAVEIFGSCNGYYVKNNWMYQIYDTGVTHQYSDYPACTMENIEYEKNLIELCHWGIEYYNSDDGSVPASRKYMKNVYMAYNVVNNTGYGWGSITRYRQRGSYAHCGYSLANANENELTEYNIYNKSAGYVVYLVANSKEVFRKNIYIQTVGDRLGLLRGTYRDCDYNAAEYFAKDLGDDSSIVIVVEK